MNKKIKPQDTQPIKPVIDIHDAFLNELDEMFNEIFDPEEQKVNEIIEKNYDLRKQISKAKKKSKEYRDYIVQYMEQKNLTRYVTGKYICIISNQRGNQISWAKFKQEDPTIFNIVSDKYSYNVKYLFTNKRTTDQQS